VFDLTGSATALAGLLAVEAIPALLISPIAGVVVDRFRRRQVMIVANLAAALVFCPAAANDLAVANLCPGPAEPPGRQFFPAGRARPGPDLVGKDKF